ncbi:IS110 family transposase [Streptomyces albidoflavus]|uniref:IS110 family transposase n=1 Tax=Streptomyces albidoflavus TaxID=1886 RepID=UPI000BADEB90|nr:IS110 family transposase [Streptomyces albidoflavus]PAX85214.1 IS110 family transposase [Streptomyces albidoflavus]PAX88501.1 IS110 family transposase [Streptomyces albidoflavus]PBO20365.1 IS110 family transposase [Streptomyces albidoflavus]PBO24005.1 IS110 family transposase [Streptomyces albidoflavus]PBO26520.1 IS110 family transposase [Streptomyces albidoflavus]
MPQIWAGVDIGKTHHHCVVLDAEGKRLLSRRVLNDESELLALLGDVLDIDEDAVWAVDVADGMATLLINVLLNHEQRLLYIAGLAVNRASAGYRGTGKTDAKDATVIADQARMRRDLTALQPDDEHAIELRVLTNRRADLSVDRTRRINRLRGQLATIFPALERALDLGNVGPLILLTGYQTPAALRRAGHKRLVTWLRNRHVRAADDLAAAALEAAERQHTVLPGEKITAQMIHTLAKEVLDLNGQIAEIGKLIEARFREHELAEVISSMPGIGPLLGAEFLAATAGDMDRYGSADRLASFAGVAPVPRDSGNISGNLHRPRRYHRGLQRVFYTSALISIRSCEASHRFYTRKRAEGKRHTQAVLALARRRVNVLWALIRDGRCFQRELPVTVAA